MVLDSLDELENFIFTEGYYTGNVFKIKSPNQSRCDQLVKSQIHELLFDLIIAIIPTQDFLEKVTIIIITTSIIIIIIKFLFYIIII